MNQVKIISDYTPTDAPNVLTLTYDDQGDVHISIYKSRDNDERGIRIAASGTRHTGRVRKAFWDLIEAYNEELADEHCNRDLRAINHLREATHETNESAKAVG